jgi:hypothetical protein
MIIEYIKETKGRTGHTIPVGRQCAVTKEKGAEEIKRGVAVECDDTKKIIFSKKLKENTKIEE